MHEAKNFSIREARRHGLYEFPAHELSSDTYLWIPVPSIVFVPEMFMLTEKSGTVRYYYTHNIKVENGGTSSLVQVRIVSSICDYADFISTDVHLAFM